MLKRKLVISGFTLIEVLIAILVVSISMTAVLVAIKAEVGVVERVRNSSLARWVGMNVIAKMQAGILPVASTEQEGVETMLGQSWYWKAAPQTTETTRIIRMKVSVALDKGELDQGFSVLGFILKE